MNNQNHNPQEKSNLKKWFARVGWLGLTFFTIKGLMWLAVFYFGAESIKSCFS
ncbi:hypothetical protein [Riemerella columbipharyngis]|uniref:Histidine kinase n=1 Tax=Riemerella columbipharyngis TaxID=1071918 RepID=A0A1G7A507_9FLAO|nr:hypothetical protein [Riemerella columbipharyngis]SDE09831.1 hypothetical protein SAMN05421544_10346 [Riemerella columbipharyngis]